MKKGVHPNYEQTEVKCACGAYKRPHRLCPACGKYRDREVVAISE